MIGHFITFVPHVLKALRVRTLHLESVGPEVVLLRYHVQRNNFFRLKGTTNLLLIVNCNLEHHSLFGTPFIVWNAQIAGPGVWVGPSNRAAENALFISQSTNLSLSIARFLLLGGVDEV
jgi:hypothetical protein